MPEEFPAEAASATAETAASVEIALSAWDPVVVAAYLALSLVIGVVGARLLGLDGKSEESYFLAGRRMPGWLNGFSLAATAMNSDVAPLYCGIAVAAGLSSHWFFLSRFGMVWPIAAMLFAVRWRQMRIRTGPEFMRLRYGRGSSFARVYSSLHSVAAGMIPWIGAGLVGLHLVAAPVFGYESRWITLAVVLPLLTAYVWASGFAGVLITDAMQGMVILLANMVLVGSVLYAFGGPSGLADAVMAAHGQVEGARLLSVLPAADNPVVSPFTVFAWAVLVTVGAGSNVTSDGQRLFSCKNDREAAKMGLWGQVILFAMLLSLMLPVLGMLARHPEMSGLAPGGRERVYGLMLAEFLPRGTVGLAVAALLAAVMSTVSTHLNYGSQTLLNDVYRPLFGEPSPGRAVWIGRLLTLLIGGLSVAVVFMADSLLGIALVVVGLFGASVSFGWAQWWWWRVNFKAWCASVLFGPVMYLLATNLLPKLSWWAERVAAGESHKQNMDLLAMLISVGMTTLVWWVVTLLSRPEDMEVLKRFYLRARPPGLWGPVRAALIAEGRLEDKPAPSVIAPGVLVALTIFACVACAFLTVSALYVGHWRTAAATAALSVGAGLLFARIFPRHIDNMSASGPAPGDIEDGEIAPETTRPE